MNLIDRFKAKYEIDPLTKCWNWTASTNGRGYGRIGLDGGKVYAHRLSWELKNGPIPENKDAHGICVLHKCDNPSCVNPDHLFIGTQSENVADMMEKGRGGYTAHKGEAHGGSKLYESDVIEIRSIYSKGKTSQRALAKIFNVNQGQIWKIVNLKSWSHI